MNIGLVEKVINATLYEGHILYPYRASSKKNQRGRFTFGRVYPRAYSAAQKQVEPCLMQTECLLRTTGNAIVNVSIRFLQPVLRQIGKCDAARLTQPQQATTVAAHSTTGSCVSNADAAAAEPGALRGDRGTEPEYRLVDELRVGDELFQTWHEAAERRVEAAPITLNPSSPASIRSEQSFGFAAERTVEPIRNERDETVGVKVYSRASVNGLVEVSARALSHDVFKVTVRISNETPMTEAEVSAQDAVLMRTFASTHTLLTVQDGEFVSLMEFGRGSESRTRGIEATRDRGSGRSDRAVAVEGAADRDGPRSVYATFVEECKNIGTWPVLVGDEGATDAMLSSPIILYDYPKIAPESPGGLFDATEIDEILTLRIKTLTAAEKLEMRHVDECARRILERTDTLENQVLLRMHGTMREPEKAKEFDDFFGANAGTRLEEVSVAGVRLKAGDRVRLRPKARADAIDMVFAGQTAIVEALEEDLEKKVHVAVILENDPGKDLGMMRQPGHRFFYGVDEIEPLGAIAE